MHILVTGVFRFLSASSVNLQEFKPVAAREITLRCAGIFANLSINLPNCTLAG